MPVRTVSRRDVSAAKWDRFVDNHPDGWWFHTSAWLDYSLEYTPGAIDLSTARVVDNGELIGISAIIVTEPDIRLVHGGQRTPCRIGDYPFAHGEGRPGQTFQVRDGDTVCFPRQTRVIDLDQPVNQLWAGVRRSYHSLIHRVQETHQIDVFTSTRNTHGLIRAMSVAERIHEIDAGRKTRPSSTWRMQERWVQDGRAALVMASDRVTRQIDGFVYVLYFKGWCYYASSASLSKNITHALIWQAMQAMKDEGVRWFEMGDVSTDDGIAMFKRGFGGTDWTVTSVASL